MSQLNKSYMSLLARVFESQQHQNQVKENGKVYRYVTREIITCQHAESFAIYAHPEYVTDWKTVLSADWQCMPKQLTKSAKGVQFGKPAKSLYIIVYDSGTVHIQGIMALQYAAENIDILLSKILVDKQVNARRRSNAFKAAMKVFGNSQPGGSNKTEPLGVITNTHLALDAPSDVTEVTESADKSCPVFSSDKENIAETGITSTAIVNATEQDISNVPVPLASRNQTTHKKINTASAVATDNSNVIVDKHATTPAGRSQSSMLASHKATDLAEVVELLHSALVKTSKLELRVTEL